MEGKAIVRKLAKASKTIGRVRKGKRNLRKGGVYIKKIYQIKNAEESIVSEPLVSPSQKGRMEKT